MQTDIRPLIQVIGGGFSGLVSAYYLERAGFAVEVFEQQPGAGGLLQTLETPYGLVESAANAVLNTRLFEELCEDLHITLLSPQKSARKRYIFRNGKPRRWPLSLTETFVLLRFAFRFLKDRKQVAPHAGETLEDWCSRVLTSEIGNYSLSAAFQGVYAGNPKDLSATLLLKRIFAFNKPPRPKRRGSVSPVRGMSELIRSLETDLRKKGVRFCFGKKIEFANEPDSPVVLATSAKMASEILDTLDPKRALEIGKIPMLPLISATAFFKYKKTAYSGFGCLLAPRDPSSVLGVLMNWTIFSGRSRDDILSETWILGGAKPHAQELLAKTDVELIELIKMERKRIFKLESELVEYRVTRWPQALPHYTIYLEGISGNLQYPSANVFLIGNYLGDIGLAQILERASRLPEQIERLGQWKN
jgi:oxygen-dependent protoporphyrinogen oxidase